MNPVIVQMINLKVNSLSKEELLSLSQQHNLPITEKQAEQVLNVLRSETINITNKQQVERMIQRLRTEVDPHVSNVVKQLLDQYGHYLHSI
ncbi:DUF2624 family protein [Alkalihalobacterium bogoriense]|uniref:DUF2624 family protein n=1 Tax=Alkalihalobacterium bogoriense TaxID=246272 RepID=UPI00047C52C1|nr:DUF2624 family protein [Alkalihalobacterium bogoriense]